MAVNGPRIAGGATSYAAGDGIDISGGVITNTLTPPSQVLDNTITSPAGVTDFGSSYIVPAGATGAWAGQTGKIASTGDGGATWDFLTPTNGTRRIINGGPNAGSTYQYKSSGNTWTAVSAATVASGAVLNVSTVVGSSNASGSGSASVTWSATYKPVSTSSIIIVEFDADYFIGGYGIEEYRARLIIGGTVVRDKRQRFQQGGLGAGSGTRSSTLLPIMGSKANTTLGNKTIQVILDRISGDDTISVYADRAWRITEIKA